MKTDAYLNFGEKASTHGQQYVTPGLNLPKSPANLFRLNASIKRFNEIRPKRVRDVGCGTADPRLAVFK